MKQSSVFRRLTKAEFVSELMKPELKKVFKGKRILSWGKVEKVSPKKTIRW